MFDRDLQEVIRKTNKGFIAQALERAAKDQERKPRTITLSNLEDAFDFAATNDFSVEALEQYRSVAQIREEVDSSDFHRRLILQGLLKQDSGQLTPTGFGLLLFGREPRMVMPQAGLLATIHYPDGSQVLEDFDGPLVLAPALVEKWLADKLPNVIDRSRMQRREVSALPFEMIREAVINGLIHRDYEIREGKCQLVITTDTIVVKSPGGPPPPILLEHLQTFNAPMLSRNPVLHYIFAKMEMAEERGLGIKSLKNGAERMGLPLPRYTWNPYLVLTLFRNQEAAVRALTRDVLEELNEAEQEGWQWLATKGRVKSGEYAAAMQVQGRTARRHLNRFVEMGLVRRTGGGASTEYEII